MLLRTHFNFYDVVSLGGKTTVKNAVESYFDISLTSSQESFCDVSSEYFSFDNNCHCFKDGTNDIITQLLREEIHVFNILNLGDG